MLLKHIVKIHGIFFSLCKYPALAYLIISVKMYIELHTAPFLMFHINSY